MTTLTKAQKRITSASLLMITETGFSKWCCKILSMSFHDDVIKWNHFPRYWPIVCGINRSPVNSPHKGQWRGALMFSLICAWINAWVNNREAGHLRRHCAHCDVTVMPQECVSECCHCCGELGLDTLTMIIERTQPRVSNSYMYVSTEKSWHKAMIIIH